jgi:GNAT superfamily N-acetyltransferase
MIIFDCPTVTELKEDKLYWEIYEEAFPSTEREPKEVILRTVEEKLGLAIRAKSLYNKETLAISVVHFLRNTSKIFLVYLAVSKNIRSKGIGAKLMDQSWLFGKEFLAKEEILAKGMVWESSHFDSAVTEEEKEAHTKRESFYLRQGGRILLDNYIQPPVDGNTLVKMKLYYRANSFIDEAFDKETINSLVRSIYWEKYNKANGISEKVLRELEERFI